MYSLTAKVQKARAQKLVENCPEDLNSHEALAIAFIEALGA
jgi:hypothetical protein